MLSRTRVSLCLVLFPASIISGQTLNTGSFLGSVKDQSGAAISGATVRILRTDPPFQREFTTDEFGNYLAPRFLPESTASSSCALRFRRLSTAEFSSAPASRCV